MSIAFCSRPAPPGHQGRAMLLGLIGVAMFSLTMPLTRIAVAELDPLFVTFGRALGAALLAGAWLAWKRAAPPPRAALLPLALVAAGCIIGFPLFTSVALRTLPASHGALLVGVLPLVTALYSALRGYERPSRGFWGMALLGSSLVIAFALFQGGGALHRADLLVFAAVASAAVGYAEGGRLSRSLGGPEVICWALLLAAPAVAPIVLWQGVPQASEVGLAAWLSFGYVTAISMFVGFFFWYRGLALGGVARVGQVQLLQPFLSLVGAALLLGEALSFANCAFALAVAAVVFAGRRMAVRQQ
ncbi:DMT family transporter [Massilia sp. IC2-477]|uniref:DMT family transporter n=1 Tax=unclassified Massilia TaxID=2609279 RepID=UPI001D0FC26F|nr:MULTISPECIES: DMT family transporter [unclassified Massilia]MCC2958208.1 DMT family transporter [Massilia sp. IC2-477]MCC2973476.1 DMT family transporter [Massilia sp. IC2-476]